jgi:hypothetical protein
LKPTRGLNRRSFLGRVTGGVAAAGAFAIIGDGARAWQPLPYTGVTDSDQGREADANGHGRHPCGTASAPLRSITDGDPTDRAGHGRGGYTGLTDGDVGRNADTDGRGRRPSLPRPQTIDSDAQDSVANRRGRTGREVQVNLRPRADGRLVAYTGANDRDSGPHRDYSGYGRCPPQSPRR